MTNDFPKDKNGMKVGESIKYRGYSITFQYPPIPIRDIDYSFSHDEWDLDDPRCGDGPNVEHCKNQIDEQISEIQAELNVSEDQNDPT